MKSIMRAHLRHIFLFVIILTFIFPCITYSQIYPPVEKDSTKAWPLQNWSIQLMYSQSPLSVDIKDMIVTVKKQLSPVSAIRTGYSSIGFFVDKFSTSSFQANYAHSEWKGENRNINAGGNEFSFSYLYYPFTNKIIQFFTGMGIVYSHYNETFNQNVLITGNGSTDIAEQYYSYQENHANESGALGTLGFEWFPIKHLSVIAEYDISFVYRNTDISMKSQVAGSPHFDTLNYTEKVYEVRSRGLKIGLSVYL